MFPNLGDAARVDWETSPARAKKEPHAQRVKGHADSKEIQAPREVLHICHLELRQHGLKLQPARAKLDGETAMIDAASVDPNGESAAPGGARVGVNEATVDLSG